MMKNFIFISPNFPDNYWLFCQALKNNGLNVLGIGDQPYDELRSELKNSLREYYKVGSLENYDEVYRAVAFFIFKYGPIDWLESNNEYWLEKDAELRTDFNINSGFKNEDMYHVKCKSAMKERYQVAQIPTARFYMLKDKAGCLEFIKKVGYPVVVKPDNGVGAASTYRIKNEADLDHFFESDKISTIQYIMEEYVDGQICSYDAIVNSKGEPLFENGNITVNSLMDIVNEQQDSIFYMVKTLAQDVRKAGRAALKSFGVKSRFIHFEFFRLLRDQKSLGKKGDIVALEVNMRPSGGISPTMMNYAHNTDVYKIWADMITYDSTLVTTGPHCYCTFLGRRDNTAYALSDEDLIKKYSPNMKLTERVPDALSGDMGNRMFLATFDTEEELYDYYKIAMTHV